MVEPVDNTGGPGPIQAAAGSVFSVLSRGAGCRDNGGIKFCFTGTKAVFGEIIQVMGVPAMPHRCFPPLTAMISVEFR